MPLPSKTRLPEHKSAVSYVRRPTVILIAVVLFGISGFVFAPRLLINSAKKAIRKGEIERALLQLNRADFFGQYAGDIDFCRARCFRRLGKTEEFSSAMKAALSHGCPVDLLDREQTYFLAQAGQLQKIEHRMANIFEDAGEDSDEACEAYANGLLINLRQKEALNVVEHWARDYPNDARPEIVRGKILKSLNHENLAEAAFKKAALLDPESTEIKMLLASHMLETGNLDEAASLFRSLSSNNLYHDEAWLNISRVERLKGNIAAAKYALGQIKEPTRFTDGQFELQAGLLAIDEKQYENAEALLRRVLIKSPRLIEAQQGIAVALRGQGRQAEASAQASTVAAIQDQLGLARRLYDTVIARPDDATPRLEIGQIELQHGDINRGIAWLQSVLNLEPGNRVALESLAKYYEEHSTSKPEFRELAEYYRSRIDEKDVSTAP